MVASAPATWFARDVLGVRHGAAATLVVAMTASFLVPVWSRAPILWRVWAEILAFMAGVSAYTIGRSVIPLLYKAGVIANMQTAARLTGVITTASVFVSLAVACFALRLAKKKEGRLGLKGNGRSARERSLYRLLSDPCP